MKLNSLTTRGWKLIWPRIKRFLWHCKEISNDRGFSLIQILVGIGLTSVLALVTAQLILNQQRHLQLFIQKQEVNFLSLTAQRALSNSAVCTWQLFDKTFSVATNPSPTIIEFTNNSIYEGPDTTSPIIATSNAILPTSSTGLRTNLIQFKNIVPTGNPSEYKGTVEISFQKSTSLLNLHPVQIPVYVTAQIVPATPNRRIIKSCNATNTSTTGLITPSMRVFTASGNFTPTISGTYKVTVIGAGGGGGSGVNVSPGPLNGAGGGGAGATVVVWAQLIAGTNYPVVVGLGGIRGPNGNVGQDTSGRQGGSSSFAGATASGGSGGGGPYSMSGEGRGGEGGSASGGIINTPGGQGGSGGRAVDVNGSPTDPLTFHRSEGGLGGASSMGGGGSGGIGGICGAGATCGPTRAWQLNGRTSNAFGSGGGGGDGQNGTGADGSSGIVIIEWFQSS